MKIKLTLTKEFLVETGDIDDETLLDAAESLSICEDANDFDAESLSKGDLHEIVAYLLEQDVGNLVDLGDVNETDFKVEQVEA